jgi:hypothetical protein
MEETAGHAAYLFVLQKNQDDQNCREEVEEYVFKHSNADFTHFICHNRYAEHVKPELDKFQEA